MGEEEGGRERERDRMHFPSFFSLPLALALPLPLVLALPLALSRSPSSFFLFLLLVFYFVCFYRLTPFLFLSLVPVRTGEVGDEPREAVLRPPACDRFLQLQRALRGGKLVGLRKGEQSGEPGEETERGEGDREVREKTEQRKRTRKRKRKRKRAEKRRGGGGERKREREREENETRRGQNGTNDTKDTTIALRHAPADLCTRALGCAKRYGRPIKCGETSGRGCARKGAKPSRQSAGPRVGEGAQPDFVSI